MYKQIIKYIEENNLLDEFQSAYRALHSTETALINVMDDFLNFKDSNFPIQILLLDLSAAFDTLDHSILEKRLLGLGFEKLALNWIMSYIKERTFSVKIYEHYSTPRFLNTGIPQGSVLGPLLFLIYIKLSNIIKKFVVLNTISMLMTSLSIQHYQTIVIIYLMNCHHGQMQLIAGLSPISYYLASLKLCYKIYRVILDISVL